MPIKPVDFQVAIPRTTEASRIGGNDANKNMNVQLQFADSMRSKAESSIKQVNTRSKPEEAGIKEKQRDNKGRGQEEDNANKGRHKSKGEDEHGKGYKNNIQTSTIDIKI